MYTCAMTVVLSHISALKYHRAYRPDGIGISSSHLETISRYEAQKAITTRPLSFETSTLYDRHTSVFQKPLNIIVSESKLRRQEPGVTYHLWPQCAPLSSIGRISHDVYCCDVSLTLAQCCHLLPAASIALLAMEFCGRYKCSSSFDGFVSASPIATVEGIRAFATRYSRVPGCARLARIARYIANGSASPMETALCIYLSFPLVWGGFGLPVPRLNYQVTLPPSAQQLTGKTCLYGDLVWPSSKLVVEYDSDTFHVGHERIASDAKRRNALTELGYTVITVTSDQIYSVQRMNEIARLIGKKVGKRFRESKCNYNEQRHNLRQLLLFDELW